MRRSAPRLSERAITRSHTDDAADEHVQGRLGVEDRTAAKAARKGELGRYAHSPIAANHCGQASPRDDHEIARLRAEAETTRSAKNAQSSGGGR